MNKESIIMTSDKIMKYIISILLGILAWIIQQSYTKTSESMAELNRDVIDIKLKLTEISTKLIDEARVRELITQELERHGLIKK